MYSCADRRAGRSRAAANRNLDSISHNRCLANISAPLSTQIETRPETFGQARLHAPLASQLAALLHARPMFDHSANRERLYTVRLEGTSLTIRDLMEVRIGPSSRLLKCYRAWLNQLESGIDSMSESQIVNARLWREAWGHASEIATRKKNPARRLG